jgi:hypothetical protein
MILAFAMTSLGYGLMLVAMTYVVVSPLVWIADGRLISLQYAWVLQLESSYLAGSILHHWKAVIVLEITGVENRFLLWNKTTSRKHFLQTSFEIPKRK